LARRPRAILPRLNKRCNTITEGSYPPLRGQVQPNLFHIRQNRVGEEAPLGAFQITPPLESRRDGVNFETKLQRRRKAMSETVYSYATHLNIKFDPLKLIDVSSLANEVTDRWYNQTLCKVNDSVVRLGVMQGEYHWHKHDNDDEFFFVLSGKFIIDLEDHSVELLRNQGFVVPKGVMHRTRAPEKSTILMIETAAIVPTGDT
jgi:mannose-6-phosphate isomerase-like protein (cupin superfamily)